MTKKTFNAEQFDEVLTEVRREAPPVGLAAITGKTPNHALKESWKILNKSNVTLTQSAINYKWRALRKANPRLAHSIEEVLVFGDALFTVIAQKQSPESLKKEFIEVKQRFAKIVKETESLAVPKEEKSLFSFFDKAAKTAAASEEKTELRLNALDQLLEEAHTQSRSLLERTEEDLLVERSFHRAVEWYIVALENAQKTLSNALEDGSLQMDPDEARELTTALGVAEVTTRSNMSISDGFLRVKEELHNKSITFLTAHENTFTVIQSHLRSWKDIQNQTQALNALSDTVKAGTALMSSASVGNEIVFKEWDSSFISQDTLASLSNSFQDYDQDIGALIGSLNRESAAQQEVTSHWDHWEETKQNIVDPILTSTEIKERIAEVLSRPVLRRTSTDAPAVETPVAVEEVAAPVKEVPVVKPYQFNGSSVQWNKMDDLVVQNKLTEYSKQVGFLLTLADAKQFQWSPSETLLRVNAPLNSIGSALGQTPSALRSQIDYVVRYENPLNKNWNEILEQQVLDVTASNWREEFVEWMKERDDLDWAYLMQWNDLVCDLLILDQDPEQRAGVLAAESVDTAQVKESLVNRIEEFANQPGLTNKDLKEWGFSGLITRYAVTLDMGEKIVDKLWSLWHNPKQPVDWNGDQASSWSEKNPEDFSNQTGQYVTNNLLNNGSLDVIPMGGLRIQSNRSKKVKNEEIEKVKNEVEPVEQKRQQKQSVGIKRRL